MKPDWAIVSEFIETALSDPVSFAQIKTLHGLGPDQVIALRRANLKPGSYRSWCIRVRRMPANGPIYQ